MVEVGAGHRRLFLFGHSVEYIKPRMAGVTARDLLDLGRGHLVDPKEVHVSSFVYCKRCLRAGGSCFGVVGIKICLITRLLSHMTLAF